MSYQAAGQYPCLAWACADTVPPAPLHPLPQLSLLWYPPMRSTGMIDALVAQGDRAAAAAAAAAARLEAALLPAVAAVVPAGARGAEGLRAWLLSAVAAM